MKKQTLAIDTPFQKPDAYGALSMPVYHTCAYEFADATSMADAFCGRTDDPDYSRVMNPTVTYLERRVMAITGAEHATALSSGMAAISNTLLSLVDAGKNVVTSRHMFGNTFALLTKTLPRLGVEPHLCNLIDLDAVENAVDDNTCCIFLEIITNPQLEVADLHGLAHIAHRHGIPLVADTTAIPFTEFSAKELGVDIEVVSTTKYLSGGATTIGGIVMDYGGHPEFTRRMHDEMLFNLGAYMTPHVAYMQNLGLENLSARYAMQSVNTVELATRLQSLQDIKAVNYLALPGNRFHDIAMQQFGGTAGCMFTIDLDSQEACFRFLNKLKLVRRATNLFDNRTLAIHPASTIFGPFSDEQRRAMDVKDTTIRISVGLESVDDIFEDFQQALH